MSFHKFSGGDTPGPSQRVRRDCALVFDISRCFVRMNEDTIVWFSASGRTSTLVSGEVKFIRIFAGMASMAKI